MQQHQDYYRILHLSENATLEDIKHSFRRLARDCHPDLHPNDAKAAERFRVLREAYEVLSDSARRSRYDRHRGTNLSHNQEKASPQVYYVRGVEKILVRDYRGAITALSEAIRLNYRFIEAYVKRCEAYIAIGEERAALEDCQQIIKYKPDHAIAYYYRGRARQRLGYADSAIKAYNKAIRLDQNFAPSYYYRGVANHELGYRQRAILDWREYTELSKKQGNTQGYRLGMKALSQYSWLPFRLGNRILEQLWSRGIEKSTGQRNSQANQPGKKLQSSLSESFQFLQSTLQASMTSLFQIVRNPVGGLLSAYGQLEPSRAILVSLGFIVLNELGFVVGLSARLPSNEENTLRWLAVGMIPVLSLWLVAGLTRLLLQPSRHWTGDLFLATTALLPLSVFSFCSPFFDRVPNLIVFMLGIFTLSHTIFLLYGGCSQLLNLSESFSALIVPIMIIVTTMLTAFGLSILF